jgi:hypothetical protein
MSVGFSGAAGVPVARGAGEGGLIAIGANDLRQHAAVGFNKGNALGSQWRHTRRVRGNQRRGFTEA